MKKALGEKRRFDIQGHYEDSAKIPRQQVEILSKVDIFSSKVTIMCKGGEKRRYCCNKYIVKFQVFQIYDSKCTHDKHNTRNLPIEEFEVTAKSLSAHIETHGKLIMGTFS